MSARPGMSTRQRPSICTASAETVTSALGPTATIRSPRTTTVWSMSTGPSFMVITLTLTNATGDPADVAGKSMSGAWQVSSGASTSESPPQAVTTKIVAPATTHRTNEGCMALHLVVAVNLVAEAGRRKGCYDWKQPHALPGATTSGPRRGYWDRLVMLG